MLRKAEVVALERKIRRNLGRTLRVSGFTRLKDGSLASPTQAKDVVRSLHFSQRRERLRESAVFVKAAWPALSKRFASGEEVVPSRIAPHLQTIKADSEESDLFRLATLTWRVPVSSGYGRRIRYIVWDQNNWKIMGLFALGDPVFNQRARDAFVGWTAADRSARLVDVMDAYVLGSIPPYNSLLCGKLVSCLVRTQEVKREFGRRYRGTKGIISGSQKKAKLVLVTTSSALGKSSVYDRLKLGTTSYLQPIGFTEGWGHFHVPDRLFGQMRQYLSLKGHRYALNHEFGDGPNWRLRATRTAISLIGWNADMLRHGIRREVYACKLATNANEVLRGESRRPSYADLLKADEVSTLALERWVLPRAGRRNEYLDWTISKTRSLLDFRLDGSASLMAARRRPLMDRVAPSRLAPTHAPVIEVAMPLPAVEPVRMLTRVAQRRA